MKPTSVSCLAVSLVVLALSSASLAEEPVLTCGDSVVAPGDSVGAAVSLTNDSDRPIRVRILARVRADRELASGKAARVRGRKARVTLRLEAGETVVQELSLEVPEDAEGPLLADCRIRGRGIRARLEHGLFAEDRPEAPELPEPEELSGTVVREEVERPSLTLDVAGGETVLLVGPEAHFLGKLMADADVAEVAATIEGIVLDLDALEIESEVPLLLVLDFDAEGIEDPRDAVVRFRPVLGGPDSKITEAETSVVDTGEAWLALLERAGVELPEGEEPPEETEDQPPPFGPRHRGRHGPRGHGPGPGPMLFAPPPPEIDFETTTLLAIFAGDQEARSHVRVLSVTRKEEGGLLCRYAVEAVPCPCQAEETSHPFLVVAIEKTAEEVEFLLEE